MWHKPVRESKQSIVCRGLHSGRAVPRQTSRLGSARTTVLAVSLLLVAVPSSVRTTGAASAQTRSSESTGTVYVVVVVDAEAGSYSSIAGFRNPEIIGRLTQYDSQSPGGVVRKVMQPSFRDLYRDSFGDPVRITWFVLSMEPYCSSTDADCDVIYSALVDGIPGQPGLAGWQQQLGEYGDAVEFHYHHVEWNDINGDGTYHWNQVLSFDQSNEFMIEKMLTVLLMNKDFFPSSYRGGWTWEDNGLSEYLEKWIPFDFSNLSPLSWTDATEPIENTYDWSRAPVERAFYHPAHGDYQIPGTMSRLLLRGTAGLDAGEIPLIFQGALTADQFVCCYTHTDNTLAVLIAGSHQMLAAAATTYGVPFKYVTADEAARLYLHASDTAAPELTVTRVRDTLIVASDEGIYQPYPFLVARHPDGAYSQIDLADREQANSWSCCPVSDDEPCVVVAAATDLSGNVGTVRYRLYLPGDLNDDERIDITDLVYFVSWSFRDGPPPVSYRSGDLDTNGTVDIVDLTYLVNYMFKGGAHLPCNEE